MKAPKTTFLPILGVKNCEIQKFFFLQFSKFLGPIDGTNNIFLSGAPFWLYSETWFLAKILAPYLEMATVPKRVHGPRSKIFSSEKPPYWVVLTPLLNQNSADEIYIPVYKFSHSYTLKRPSRLLKTSLFGSRLQDLSLDF